MSELTREEKSKYLSEILEVTRASMNEEQLKIGCEEILKRLCEGQGIFWNSYTLPLSNMNLRVLFMEPRMLSLGMLVRRPRNIQSCLLSKKVVPLKSILLSHGTEKLLPSVASLWKISSGNLLVLLMNYV